jgi:hypothetical protein
MNESNIPEFNRESIKKVIFQFLDDNYDILNDKYEAVINKYDVDEISKEIMQYAESCGIVPPQSTMKRGY